MSCCSLLKSVWPSLDAMLVHSIWWANSLLWDGKVENPALVSHLAGLHLSDFIKAQPTLKLVNFSLLLADFLPHRDGSRLMLTCFLCSYKFWGCWCVRFSDEVGCYARDFARKISNVTTPKMFEVLAARDGVCLASQRSWQQVILECGPSSWKLEWWLFRYWFADWWY